MPFKMRSATQEDLKELYGSGNLLIGSPVTRKPSAQSSEPTAEPPSSGTPSLTGSEPESAAPPEE